MSRTAPECSSLPAGSSRASSEHYQPVVRTVQVDRPVELRGEVEPMLGEEWKDRVDALLQVAFGEDQTVE